MQDMLGIDADQEVVEIDLESRCLDHRLEPDPGFSGSRHNTLDHGSIWG